MKALSKHQLERCIETAMSFSAKLQVTEQQKARALLFEGTSVDTNGSLEHIPHLDKLNDTISKATEIFLPNSVQQVVYEADTGTHIVPEFFKKILTPIRISFIIRPGCIEDLRQFCEWARQYKVHYTIRGAGTWPFGGCVPFNGDVVVDLSALKFFDIDTDNDTLTVGAGVIFPDMRNELRQHGYTLRQEISNTYSGTICGWIATGGIGLDSFKYGHVKTSVLALVVVTPQGEIVTLTPDDESFDLYFNSEGQFGIIAAATLTVRKNTYVSKPYAFAFRTCEDAHEFMQMLYDARLNPTSVIYFDDRYIHEIYHIEKEHAEHKSSEALRLNDQVRLAEAREDYDIIGELQDKSHIVVLHFDEIQDYEKALKSKLFGASGEQRRVNHTGYYQFTTSIAHRLWDHRYLPVQIKQRGPSLLVSETVLPFASFPDHQKFLRNFLKKLLNVELLSEAHLLPDGDILIQSLFLADTRTFRHKIYFALVPIMTHVAHHFGAKPYGIGVWNYPFISKWRQLFQDRAGSFAKFKPGEDPYGLINRGKFLNPRGQTFAFKVFKIAVPLFNQWLVNNYDARIQGRKIILTYPLELIFWRMHRFIIPFLVPPDLKAPKKEKILDMTAVCAECDSCERVCPTSDVFGVYGPATPITRRITANRIASGKSIQQEEAIGFLICTRCDNCTHICPTDIQLTDLFDMVEADDRFQRSLGLSASGKNDIISRSWQIMKESPLYIKHTIADQKEDKSHLEHGISVLYKKGFEYSQLEIDPMTCIHCGMCAHENACIYGARKGHPREIPELLNVNCALCNACVNYCPQNKIAQAERQYLDKLIKNAADLEEKKYWIQQQNRIHDTTKVIRSPYITDMADRYVTEEIIMEIDKEASTGKIPVSGSGQGDRHMGIGFDAERFAHFHIVGPAQNRLHEGDPDEELSVILGKREDFCKFDNQGNLLNPVHPTIKLMTPILYNAVRLESNGKVELVIIKTAEQQKSLAVLPLERMLEYYSFIIKEGGYDRLPDVIIPRVDHELIHRLIVNPHTNRDFLKDLWRMPVFEVEYHPKIERTLRYIRDSVAATNGKLPLISGRIEISEYDLIGSLTLNTDVKEKVNHFLDQNVDILHVHGLQNKDQYYVTSQAIRALHRYLMRIGRRHEVSIIASGGIRLASDTQKTIQRGAEATLIDFAALLALDPSAYRALIEKKPTTEKLLSLDIDWAIERLNNQAESRKVQILEVLGASGFKDIKKTVGEEGRLIDFYKLENRIQRNIFEKEETLKETIKLNDELIQNESISDEYIVKYSYLKKEIRPAKVPHDFYRLGDTNQNLYKRDFVWPGSLIESMGRMAAGDLSMLDFNNVEGTGLLGDGFDVMQILYNKNPMDIPEYDLNSVRTALPLDKGLVLKAPWMFGGKSVGSIGLDTWKAHVTASRQLGIQYDTGEGGYPTCFFLNSKGEPIFFTEDEIQLIKPYFKSGQDYTVQDIRRILEQNNITRESHPAIYDKIKLYPSLKPFHFLVVVDTDDEPYITTELKTGLFGVTKQTIRKARRVVIAYSQGAKMGIGGHILAQKVNKLVSYMRGVEGVEQIRIDKVEQLYQKLLKIQQKETHPLKQAADKALPVLDRTGELKSVSEDLKSTLWNIQEEAYNLYEANNLDPIEFEMIIRSCEEIIEYSYSSIISPFPFHNCYSIEDVKAFIDVIRMINPDAVISIKVSPSIDIEFIAAGLARIAKDNTDEILKMKFGDDYQPDKPLTAEMTEHAKRYGMKIEIWLDGPRGGTGASPNIIKGQMGMHLEYAIPLIHDRLVKDGLRNYVTFMVSGGIRTYEDVIKSVALGADGIIWGTAPLVAIGCDRNRNCHDGCSRGIATSNLIMQKLRDVEENTQQIINAFTIIQMQVIRALAALGLNDLRELRGRHDKIHWIGLKERVDHRYRVRTEVIKEIEKDEQLFDERRAAHATGQTNCGVAAINGTELIPGYILDETLKSMRNRGMDGVGIAKTLCFPDHAQEYAFRVLVKGVLQKDIEDVLADEWKTKNQRFSEKQVRVKARERCIEDRTKLMKKIKKVFIEPYFEFHGEKLPERCRELYKVDDHQNERDYREFGNEQSDPGDIYCFFVRVKPEILYSYIETELLTYQWSRFLKQQFAHINPDNYKQDQHFLNKAEDLFVFNHSMKLSRILYVSVILPHEIERFAQENNYNGDLAGFHEEVLKKNNIGLLDENYLTFLRDFIQKHPYEHNKHRYDNRKFKIAAVMSCGKNFGLWKTAGREIPWQTPDAPNNLIHVRLATGSEVEQMNSHPFGKLHTALTHNGETTNYEALKQRVEQFELSPLAGTDTEVASLKFHLTADEWQYPDWALFESFSPTTGDDLELVDEKLRPFLEEIQRVEFTSSPDGPYQYLCLRHNPYERITERVDLKDPADLRPNISAFWYDKSREKKKAFSIIASEEHAVKAMLEMLDNEGIIKGAVADRTFVSPGMISRYHYDENNEIKDFTFLDRYGREIYLEETEKHYSVRKNQITTPENIERFQDWEKNYKHFINDHLKTLTFEEFHWMLHSLVQQADTNDTLLAHLEILTYLNDYIRTIDPGDKAQSSLIDCTVYYIDQLLNKADQAQFTNFTWCDQQRALEFKQTAMPGKQLIINAGQFQPEGIDPAYSLGSFLKKAYNLGWRKFIIYQARGQRLISPAVMGTGSTDDVEIDVYGSAGEYFGAFMQGGILRLHGNAQNFCAMCMHHGNIYVFGNAGKVCGYASKGGKVFIMGDVVDRGWTNSVDDSRCQKLNISILGSATKYAGESLMGGRFFFGGLYFNNKGQLSFNDRPYLGTKMMGGASRGEFIFFDPEDRLHPAQYTHAVIKEFTNEAWNDFYDQLKDILQLSNISVCTENQVDYIIVNSKNVSLSQDNFKLLVPKGGLKGYESH